MATECMCRELASETINGDCATCEVVAYQVRKDEYCVCATLTWNGGESVQERRSYRECDALADYAIACIWARRELGM